MKKVLIPFVLLIIVIVGCSGMNDSNQSEKNNSINANNEEENEKYDPKHYAPIQEYTGEGYTLEGARKETGEIANEHREEVEKAVEDFFLDEYKTEVKVHNIVSAKDGVSVFVESIGEPHFYSFAIIPVDIKNKKVLTDEVWSQEGQVEDALAGALYAMAHKEEFQRLDDYLNKFKEEFSLQGTPEIIYETVKGNGYTTQYYFVSTIDDVFDNLVEKYIQNPNITEAELIQYFEDNTFDPEGLNIGIEYYMTDKDSDPNEEVYDKIFDRLQDMDGIPKGEYYLYLNDNYILIEAAIGKKENTINKTLREGIKKD